MVNNARVTLASFLELVSRDPLLFDGAMGTMLHAKFLHNEIPGIIIPDAARERMRRAGEDGPQERVGMAQELLAELYDLMQGVYLMPAFNRFDLAAEIIEAVRSI